MRKYHRSNTLKYISRAKKAPKVLKVINQPSKFGVLSDPSLWAVPGCRASAGTAAKPIRTEPRRRPYS